jgi:hypothetical protein
MTPVSSTTCGGGADEIVATGVLVCDCRVRREEVYVSCASRSNMG